MRCRKCQYPLWNLRSRVCPECGSPFRPSEFEFAPCAVQFRCPHCDQAYFGTGEKGRLVPDTFNCVGCGNRIDMDDMVLQPAAGVDEDKTGAERMPWLERRRLGIVRAWFSTIRGSMTGPTRLIRATPDESATRQAWWFAALTIAPYAIVGVGPFVLLPLGLAVLAPQRVGAAAVAGMCVGMATVIAGIILANLLGIVVWGGLTHLLLRITGKPDGSLNRTYQALCYSSGPIALGAVPCLGFYTIGIGAIWWAVSAILMVKESQKVGGARAALAVLVPPGLATLLLVAAYAAIIYSVVSGTGPFALPSPPTSASETKTVSQALLAYYADHGVLPGHAIELVQGDYLVAGQLVSASSGTVANRVPVGGARLGQFDFMRAEARNKAVQAAVNGLPAGTIAHRLGDFVFTYHGTDLSDADAKRWIVVCSPEPTTTTRPAGPVVKISPFGKASVRIGNAGEAAIAVGRADGTAHEIAAGEFSDALDEQNVLRAKCNLPPLPDPRTVTHSRPAVAPSVASSRD